VYTLQNVLHVTLQLGLFCLQPPVTVDLGYGRLIIQTMYCRIYGRVFLMIRLEHVEVGGVVTGVVHCHQAGSDVESLSVQIWATFDDGQDERIIGHDDLDVVRLVGVSSRVGDREMNSTWPHVSYEPSQNNVWPVL